MVSSFFFLLEYFFCCKHAKHHILQLWMKDKNAKMLKIWFSWLCFANYQLICSGSLRLNSLFLFVSHLRLWIEPIVWVKPDKWLCTDWWPRDPLKRGSCRERKKRARLVMCFLFVMLIRGCLIDIVSASFRFRFRKWWYRADTSSQRLSNRKKLSRCYLMMQSWSASVSVSGYHALFTFLVGREMEFERRLSGV